MKIHEWLLEHGIGEILSSDTERMFPCVSVLHNVTPIHSDSACFQRETVEVQDGCQKVPTMRLCTLTFLQYIVWNENKKIQLFEKLSVVVC